MTESVHVADLSALLDDRGLACYLITVGQNAAPHLVSVSVERVSGDVQLIVGVGGGTAANAALHPAVTLLWPAVGDEPYCLIVDGTASAEPWSTGALRVTPTTAVLHRMAGADPDLASCIKVAADN